MMKEMMKEMKEEMEDAVGYTLFEFWCLSLGILGDMLAGRGRLGTCLVLSKLVVCVEFGGMVDH
jgi:hypothetical protein